ncbi:MAG: exosortase A [Blastocatellales bacterium]
MTGAIAVAWGALYFDTLRRLVDDWRVDENYSHGFLIPIISAYAIWGDREQIFSMKHAPRFFLGGSLMVIAVLMLFAGIAGAEMYVARISMVLSLAALVVYFRGIEWLRRLAFPIGLLLFAIPVPNIVFNQIAFPMQLMASDYATRAIKLFGVPALREGNVIELAQMKLQVVEACSGIRSLMTLAALAVVYAYFTEKLWRRRIALVAAVIPIAIIANAARVAGTGVMAHAWGIQAAEGFLHGFSGWLVFVVAVLLLLAFARAMSWIEKLIAHRKLISPLSSPSQRDD